MITGSMDLIITSQILKQLPTECLNGKENNGIFKTMKREFNIPIIYNYINGWNNSESAWKII